MRNQLFPHSVVLEDLKDELPARADDLGHLLSAIETVDAILTNVLNLAKWESGDIPARPLRLGRLRIYLSVCTVHRPTVWAEGTANRLLGAGAEGGGGHEH